MSVTPPGSRASLASPHSLCISESNSNHKLRLGAKDNVDILNFINQSAKENGNISMGPPAPRYSSIVWASLDCEGECVNTNNVQVNISKTRIETHLTFACPSVALFVIAGLVCDISLVCQILWECIRETGSLDCKWLCQYKQFTEPILPPLTMTRSSALVCCKLGAQAGTVWAARVAVGGSFCLMLSLMW